MNTAEQKSATQKKRIMDEKNGFVNSVTNTDSSNRMAAVALPTANDITQIDEIVHVNERHTTATTPAKNSDSAYLTKLTLVKKAQAAGRVAAKNAMQTMGFVITAQYGWIVKKYVDGRIEKIVAI